MTPYYDHAGITIYHGDAREVLPEIAPPEVILTDPPWPLGAKGDSEPKEVMQGNLNAVELWHAVSPMLDADRLLVWLPCHSDPRDYLNPLHNWPYLRTVYLRRCIPGYFGRVLMDGEIVHALGTWPKHEKGKSVIPGGMEMTYIKSDRVHGHPGPRSLIATKWLLKWWTDSARSGTVLDPFLGSGTTLVAAKYLGLNAVGIEIEEKYCEMAAERLSQEVMDLAV